MGIGEKCCLINNESMSKTKDRRISNDISVRSFICLVYFVVLPAFLVHAGPPLPPPGGHWVVMPELTDEFNVSELDTSKWYNYHPYWTGRTPSQFVPQNVAVSNGFLQLRMTTAVTNMADVQNPQYENWVEASCVSSKTRVAEPYCYYEASIKVGRLCMANAFWFHKPSSTVADSEEIDVIENFGEGQDPATTNLMLMNTHYCAQNGANDVSTPRRWQMPYDSASDFHVYGMWRYETNDVRFYHNDSNVVSVVPGGPMNDKHYMFFCNEVQLWNGLPTLESLHDPQRNTMTVDWVHSWRLVPDSDVAVGVTDSPDPVVVGNPLTYMLAITNLGPLSASNVVVVDTLPHDVTFSSASASQGSPILSGRTVICQLGTMASNACATMQITVVPDRGGSFTNTICANSPAEWGLYSSNNIASTVTTVLSLQKLEVRPSVLDFGTIRTGVVVQAQFIVTNSGDFALSGTAGGVSAPFAVVSGSPYTVAARSAANVVVSFTAPGAAATNTDNVIFTSNGGNSTNAVTAIAAGDSPVAMFTGSPTSGAAALTVMFTDTSMGSITNRVWDFGDGTTLNTNLATFEHTYVAVGGKTVTLVVSGPVGSSSQTRSNYVNVAVPLAATWTNAAPSGNWSVAGNWNPSIVPDYGGDVIFGTGGRTSVVDTVSPIVSSVIFNRAGDFVVAGSGGGLIVNRGIAASNSEVYAINVPITLGSTNTWFVNAGGLLQVSGPIDGASPLTKTGDGMLTLTATNTYSGGTTISAGTVRVDGGVVSNVSIGATAGAALVVVNGGRVFNSADCAISNGVNNSKSVIIDGANSAWMGKAGNRIYINGSADTLVQVANGGVVSNFFLLVGYGTGAHRNSLVITNGGQVFAGNIINIASSTSLGGGNSNCVYVGSTTNATSLLNGRGFAIELGKGNNSVTGNRVKVDQGGVITNISSIKIGSAGSSRNSIIITNGGQMFTAGASTNGIAAGANSNSVIIAGANGAVNSRWYMGGSTLAIGGNASATGNSLAVWPGGVLTNGSVTLGGVGSVFTVGGVADLSGLTLGGTGSLLALNNGYLRVPGVIIGTSSTLSGTGSISAPVTVNGNLVRGNGGGILTVSNSLTLSSSAVLQGAFGATGDVVAVTGTLTLDGTINITNAGGFAPGTYVLFTYPAGNLVNNGLAIGTVPDESYGYAVDTSLAGYVRLVVTRPTFTSWLTHYPGVGAWNDDPDGDGEKNLMEYALNRNPMSKDQGGFVLSRDSNSLPTVVYTRRLPPHDISYWIERCSNLINSAWDTNGFSEIRAVDDGNGLTETVTMQDGVPITNTVPRFYRLKVTQP